MSLKNIADLIGSAILVAAILIFVIIERSKKGEEEQERRRKELEDEGEDMVKVYLTRLWKRFKPWK